MNFDSNSQNKKNLKIVKHPKSTPNKKNEYIVNYITVKIFKENGWKTSKCDEGGYYKVSKPCGKLFPNYRHLQELEPKT